MTYFVREALADEQGGKEEQALLISELELKATNAVPGKYTELARRKTYGFAEPN